MHFYTYDEWYANNYYSQDRRAINKNNTQIHQLSNDENYLIIRSYWSDPVFVSTYTEGTPSIVPETENIDLDVGCLYSYKHVTRETTSFVKGVIQPLGNNLGSINSSPYMFIVHTPANEGHIQAKTFYDNFSNEKSEIIVIDLSRLGNTNTGDTNTGDKYRDLQLLVFQSVYSGSITFQEANSGIEFYFLEEYSDKIQNTNSYDGLSSCRYNYKIPTNLYCSDSLMIAACRITLDITYEGNKSVIIDNLSEFVYGHNDMDRRYNENMHWKCFKPSINAKVLNSSIMHYTKF